MTSDTIISIIRNIDLDIANISIRSDGIMHVTMKNKEEFGIDEVKLIRRTRKELAQGKSYPILYTGDKLVLPTKEARAYMAEKSDQELAKAEAMIIKSLPQRMIASTYIRINKPKCPTRFFENESDAIEWLKEFV